MCELKGINANDIGRLVGVSATLALSWLDLANENSFPSHEMLATVLKYAGLSFEGMLDCEYKSDCVTNRIYHKYTVGKLNEQQIDPELLTLPKANEILDLYLLDRARLILIVDDYVNGQDLDIRGL